MIKTLRAKQAQQKSKIFPPKHFCAYFFSGRNLLQFSDVEFTFDNIFKRAIPSGSCFQLLRQIILGGGVGDLVIS